MATISGVVKSPIKGKLGTLNRSSGFEYRDFWYTQSNGKKVHVRGWHKAVDITTLGTIIAFEKGKVVSIVKGITGQTTNPSGGNQIKLEHANGDKTVYCHLDNGSNNHLKIGDIVKMGDKMGTDTIKTTGNSTGKHLHFAIYIKEKGDYIDPTPYLQGKKSLKPYGFAEPVVDITKYYTVKKGDTLISIGKKLGINWKDLYELNKDVIGPNYNIIKVGQKLKLTTSEEHICYKVKKGDNLSSIAKKYKTTWQKIYEHNKDVIGKNPNLIYPGQKLLIK
jgi:murein DD-endopeptidase MepM/ murein hydrolase activator NlpD